MKLRGLSFWFLICLTLLSTNTQKALSKAETIVTLPDSRINLADSLRFLADRDERLTPHTAIEQGFESFPSHFRLDGLNQGVFWILGPKLINVEQETIRYFLQIRSNSQYSFDVYLFDGDQEPWKLDTIPLRHPSFELNLPPDVPHQFLVRAVYRTHLWVKPTLHTQESIWVEDRYENALLTYCIGTLLTALVFHIAMFASLRDTDRAWFIGFIAGSILIMVLAHDFPRGLQSWLNLNIQQYVIMFRTLLTVIAIMFLRSVFQTHESMPKLDIWAKSTVGVLLFLALSQLTQSNIRAIVEQNILPIVQIFTAGLNLTLIAKAIALGFRPAILILIGWVIITVGGSVRLFADPGYFQMTMLVLYAPVVSLTIQSILVSVALGFKFRKFKLAEIIAKKKKEEARKLKFFLRLICHDLANPLSVVTLAGGALLKKYPDDRMVEKLAKSTKLMNEIIEYVRSSELNASSKTKMDKVNLRRVIDELLVIFDDRIRQKNIDLQISVSNKIHVFSHETNLKMQVIGNLLSNAIKFSPEGGTVQLRAEEKLEAVKLDIIDSGQGIPVEIIQALDSTDSDRVSTRPGTKGETGSGFGLSLAWEAIHQCGGKLHIELLGNPQSQCVLGTQITLILPIATSSSTYANSFVDS